MCRYRRELLQPGWLTWPLDVMKEKRIIARRLNSVSRVLIDHAAVSSPFLIILVTLSFLLIPRVACQKKTEWCFVSAHSKTLNLDRSLACQTPRQTNCVFPDSIIAVNRRCVSGRCDLARCLPLSHFLCFPALPSVEPCNCSCQVVALGCVLYLPLPWP